MTMMATQDDLQGDSPTTTKLLTLLNVSATKPGKRKRSGPVYLRTPLGGKRGPATAATITTTIASSSSSSLASTKFHQVNDNARAAAQLLASVDARNTNGDHHVDAAASAMASPSTSKSTAAAIPTAPDSDDEGEGSSKVNHTGNKTQDAFHVHFASDGQGSHAALLSGVKPDALEWEQTMDQSSPQLGKLIRSQVKGMKKEDIPSTSGSPHANAVSSWQEYRGGPRNPPSAMQRQLLDIVSSYSDLYHSNLSLASRADAREAIVCHAVSHAIKTRRRILKNNERLAHAAQSAAGGGMEEVEPPRDQGFTRPKVLILAPMRNTALEWVQLLESLSGCPQVENKGRLSKEYNLPEGAVDKLALPEASQRYPLDHLDTFRGNIDDNFQLGAKLTRKSLKLFSAFYDSDFILASPLALRLAIEKDRDSDFLSSIEVLIVDQMDVMAMQNWDHLQFVLGHLNKIPKQSHDTDFSRVRQWYLDGQAAHLRQSILLSSYDAPEMRSLYSRQLVNIAGKVRTLQDASGVMDEVRSGIRSNFHRFDCANPSAEHDIRFNHFTQKTLQNLLKSAVSSSKTIIFIPSYFDFVRVQEYLTSHQINFTSLSEYSSGKEIARARQEFLSGKRNFLLMTERFHFYRRYVVRGCETIVFYGLPEHPSFFVEVLSFPFAKGTSLVDALNTGGAGAAAGGGGGEEEEKEGQMEVDPTDVSMLALYSRYDLLRLQRIVGMDLARRMVEEERGTWRFT